MRLFAYLLLASFVFASKAQALEAPALCALVPSGLSKVIGEFLKGKGTCDAFCTGCGCKGGPGYRDHKGCVPWAQLEDRCGKSPHKDCTKECIPVVPECIGRAAAILKVIEAMRERGTPIDTVPPDPATANSR